MSTKAGFRSYERVEADNTVKDADDLTIPDFCTHAELQADTQNIHYTMDDATDPTQAGIGMVLLKDEPPIVFTIGNVKKIRFDRGAGSNGYLNIHYAAPLDVG